MAALNFLSALLLIAVVSGKLVHEMQIDKKSGFQWKKSGFQWKNCQTGGSPVILFKELSLKPDPVVLGKNFQISYNLDVSEDVGANPKMPVNVISKVEFRSAGQVIDLCSYAKKFCNMKNICSVLDPSMCPTLEALGFPCKCPLAKKTYKKQNVEIPNTLSFAIQGTLNATVVVSEGPRQIGCLYIELCVQSCEN